MISDYGPQVEGKEAHSRLPIKFEKLTLRVKAVSTSGTPWYSLLLHLHLLHTPSATAFITHTTNKETLPLSLLIPSQNLECRVSSLQSIASHMPYVNQCATQHPSESLTKGLPKTSNTPREPRRNPLMPLLHWLHVVWKDLFWLLAVSGIALSLNGLKIFRPYDRIFPMWFNAHSGLWEGPIEFSYPHMPMVLSTINCALVIMIIPLAILFFMQLFVRSFWDWNAATLGLLKAMALMYVYLSPFETEFRLYKFLSLQSHGSYLRVHTKILLSFLTILLGHSCKSPSNSTLEPFVPISSLPATRTSKRSICSLSKCSPTRLMEPSHTTASLPLAKSATRHTLHC